jgi:hypothetical protein
MKVTIQNSNKLDNDILNLFIESISKEVFNSNVTTHPLLKFDIHDCISKTRNQLGIFRFELDFRKTQTIKRNKDFSHIFIKLNFPLEFSIYL